MLYILFGVVAYAKIVDNKAENNVSCCVLPKACCVLDWVVAKSCQVFNQLVVRKSASLWETTHSLPNFDQYISVFGYVVEVVLFDDFGGQ